MKFVEILKKAFTENIPRSRSPWWSSSYSMRYENLHPYPEAVRPAGL